MLHANSPPLTPEDALERARQQASEFCRRTYAPEDHAPVFSSLHDFVFTVNTDEAPCIECSKRGALWAKMTLDAGRHPPTVLINGQTIRIDAVGVMLSYLALRCNASLSYEHPVLKQTLTADPHGSLTLS